MIRNLAIAAACLLIAGCGGLASTTAEQPAEAAEVASAVEAPPEPDYYAQALQQGMDAAVAAGKAKTADEWQGVLDKWLAAIKSLQLVPSDNQNYETARAKISEYEAAYRIASDRKAKATAPVAASPAPTGGYSTYTAKAGLTGTTEIQWRWLKGGEIDCDYGTCWGIEVVAVEGCDSSLYVELALEDEGGINVGMTNDTTGKVGAGQKARLIFNAFDEGARRAGISEMSCY